MREYWHFDVTQWLQGGYSPHVASHVIAMIRELPKASRYVTLIRWRHENEGDSEADPDGEESSQERLEAEERHEMRMWAGLDYELQALQVNLLQDLLRYVPQWKKTPELSDPVGPPHWKRNKKQAKKGDAPAGKTENRPATVLDAMKAMGFDPGG